MTAKTTPKVIPTQFGSWRSAYTWAYHVARAGRFKTKVQKINGRWCAWRVL